MFFLNAFLFFFSKVRSTHWWFHTSERIFEFSEEIIFLISFNQSSCIESLETSLISELIHFKYVRIYCFIDWNRDDFGFGWSSWYCGPGFGKVWGWGERGMRLRLGLSKIWFWFGLPFGNFDKVSLDFLHWSSRKNWFLSKSWSG